MVEERFAGGASILHRADPRVKIIGAMFLACIVAVSPSLLAVGIGLVIGVMLLLIAGLQYRHVIKQLLAVNMFIVFIWLVLPVTGQENAGALIRIGPVPLYAQGIELALLITIKANAINLYIITLLATSSVQRLGAGLRRLGFSKTLTFLFLASWRYLDIIHQEYLRLRRAAMLRCFRPATNIHTYKTYGYLIGMTLLHSYNRANRIHNAMALRGFNGIYPVFDNDIMRPADYFLVASLTACVLLLAVLSFI